jgi:uncharacterized membrane protein
MSDQQQQPTGTGSQDVRKWMDPGHDNALLVYILYFVSLAIGITAIIGVIIAYVNRGKAGGYVETHYTWLIRTFWIGLLYACIAALLAFVAIGFLLMIAVLVWAVVRMVMGIQALSRREPVRNPDTWWI